MKFSLKEHDPATRVAYLGQPLWQKFVSLLFASIFLFSTCIANAASPKPNLSHDAYSKDGNIDNPFDQFGSKHFECTRYAFGRAYEKTGVVLKFSKNSGRHAKKWYKLIKDLPKGKTPRANSIVVFSWGKYGHVAFVEAVKGNKIIISQANSSKGRNGKYTAKYDGTRTISSKKRGIIGYIYLGGVTVYDFWRKSDPIHAGQRNGFDAQFKLKNGSKKTVRIKKVAMAIHDSRHRYISDMKIVTNVRISPNRYYHMPITHVTAPRKPGRYFVVAKIYENGRWRELASTRFKVR